MQNTVYLYTKHRTTTGRIRTIEKPKTRNEPLLSLLGLIRARLSCAHLKWRMVIREEEEEEEKEEESIKNPGARRPKFYAPPVL